MLRRLRQPIVVVPVVIVVLIVGGWWLAFRPGDDAGASATTVRQLVEVTQGPMSETVSADGTVAAAETDDLSFSSSGIVTAVNVKAGDTVKAGQVLATVDSASLSGDVAGAEADVASAEAKLSDDRDAGASDAQITADETSLASANDSLDSANEALAGASLVATFDGTVASIDLTVGEHLSSSGTGGTDATGSSTGTGRSSSSLPTSSSAANGGNGNDSSSSTAQIQVVSAGRYTVQLSVDTSDISRIKVGQTATVTPSASGSSPERSLPGRLLRPRWVRQQPEPEQREGHRQPAADQRHGCDHARGDGDDHRERDRHRSEPRRRRQLRRRHLPGDDLVRLDRRRVLGRHHGHR